MAPRPADLTSLREKHRPSRPQEAVGQHVCVAVLCVHRFQNIPLVLRGLCILGRSTGWQVAHHPLRLTLNTLLWGPSTCPVAGCPRSWQPQCQRHHVPSRGDGLAGAWLCPSPALNSSPHHPSVSLAFRLLMKGSAPPHPPPAFSQGRMLALTALVVSEENPGSHLPHHFWANSPHILRLQP